MYAGRHEGQDRVWSGPAETVDTDGAVFGPGTIETVSARHRIVAGGGSWPHSPTARGRVFGNGRLILMATALYLGLVISQHRRSITSTQIAVDMT